MKIKLIIVQLEAIAGDIEKNIEKAETLLEKGGISSADLIILPELWTTGWDCERFNEVSEELYSSKTYKFIKETALKYNSNIIGGSSVLKKDGEKDRNSCIIMNRNGELLAVYDKYHLFSHRGQSEGSYLEEGTTALLINTDIGKIGISICYDIRFPEMFRLYAFNNADLIVNMAAWPQSFVDEYVTLAKARAIENQIFFISCCLTGKINETFKFSGNSMICDYKGRIITGLKEEEKILSANIDLDEMKQYRIQMPILNDTKLKYKLTEK
ncbi:MAG: hypothetical protein LUH11_04255 [Candidatus Gastranaerophilales bacterium]|nr:hypothetical protein [Candidatus Gastranaerophilales bacterium]